MGDRTAENTTLPVDPKTGLAYVWLIWGVTAKMVELIAIATNRDAKARYIEAGKQRPDYYSHVRAERAFVDHIYGQGDLVSAQMYLARDALRKAKG